MKSNQKNKVIGFIREHGSITQRQAIPMGIYRLSGRIYDLIHDDGYDIVTTMKTVINKDGSKSRIAVYSLGGGDNEKC